MINNQNSTNMKKLLITGGAGYIGTRMCNELCNEYDITVCDLFWFGDFLDPKIKRIKKDIKHLTVDDVKGFDVVLFLGGLSNDPMAMYRPDINFIENSAVPTYLAFIAKEAGVKKFIGASSCSVYGFTENKTLTEQSSVQPSFAYGISKLQCERGIMILEDDSFKPILFRKGTVGGWSPKMRFDLVINTMLMTALTEKKITVNSPNLWRPLIDIRDVIQGYKRAIDCGEEVSGVFNLSGVNYTIGELGRLIHERLNDLGHKVDLEVLDVEDFRNYKVNTDKVSDALNFTALYKPIDTINEILENIDLDSFDFTDDNYYNIKTFKKIM
jgi:nucleoside-diphosphate-sugar epimerase